MQTFSQNIWLLPISNSSLTHPTKQGFKYTAVCLTGRFLCCVHGGEAFQSAKGTVLLASFSIFWKSPSWSMQKVENISRCLGDLDTQILSF